MAKVSASAPRERVEGVNMLAVSGVSKIKQKHISPVVLCFVILLFN